MAASVQHDLRSVLNHSMQDITTRFAGIQLLEQDTSLSNDVCTVHTTWEGGHRATLVLRADRSLLTRLAQAIMHAEAVTAQDIEDVSTEYFNIICGRIAGRLFQTAHISSRFQIPRFYPGSYLPDEDCGCRCELNYISDQQESVQLVFMKPAASGAAALTPGSSGSACQSLDQGT